MRFREKVVLVTGAGQGMGREIAKAFAREGALVAVSARTGASGTDTLNAILAEGGHAFLACGDVAVQHALKALVDEAAGRHGRLDVVVHCAADAAHGLVVDMPEETFDLLVRSNIHSVFWLAKYAHRYLTQASGAGRLIYISSNGANRTFVPAFAPYAASKAFLNAFARNLAVEFGAAEILVNVVEPGMTATERMLGKLGEDGAAAMAAGFPVPRVGKAEDVASAVLFLASEAASYMTGAALLVDGGSSMVPLPGLSRVLESH